MLVYGLSKPSSLSSTEAWLKPTASLAVRGEKLGGDPQIGQSTYWRCSGESLFLGSSGIRPNLSVTHERLLYVDHMRICMVEGHTWTEHGKHVACWSGFPLQGVHQFESP
jgi:hypothetical protein